MNTLVTYREEIPDVRVQAAFIGTDTIVASVRIDHPNMAPLIVAAADEDDAARIASSLRRAFALAADAGRAEVEDEYGPQLAAVESELLEARRQLAGCDDDDEW